MKKFTVQFIIEILGRPPEYIVQALQQLLETIAKEKSIHIIEKIVHPPTLVKDAKDLYITFVDITAEIDSLKDYFAIIFSYFPAHMQVISPQEFPFSKDLLNEVGATLIQRIHEYEAITKKMIVENKILQSKLQQASSPAPLASDNTPLPLSPTQEPPSKIQQEQKKSRVDKRGKKSLTQP